MAFNGEWALDKSENYDAFLKAAGMNAVKRAMVTKLGGSLTITSKDADNIVHIKNVNGPKTKEKDFPIGKEVDDEGADGTPAKGTLTIEDGKLITRFVTQKGKKVTITREAQNGVLTQTMDFDGAKCTRYYKKK